MDGMRIQIANMAPDNYARTAKKSAELSAKLSKQTGTPLPPRIQQILDMSHEELADAQRKAQRERARDVDATVEVTYGYMGGLGITRQQYERMIERLHMFEYAVVKTSSLEFE